MKKKSLPIILIGILTTIAIILIVVNVVIPANKYKKATSLMEKGEYESAAELFTVLGKYKDSEEKAADAQQEADYQAADERSG